VSEAIRIQLDVLMPAGKASLMRWAVSGFGEVVAIGTLDAMLRQYRHGDLVFVAQDIWDGIEAVTRKRPAPSAGECRKPARCDEAQTCVGGCGLYHS
jgi:hypothetical protein